MTMPIYPSKQLSLIFLNPRKLIKQEIGQILHDQLPFEISNEVDHDIWFNTMSVIDNETEYIRGELCIWLTHQLNSNT